MKVYKLKNLQTSIWKIYDNIDKEFDLSENDCYKITLWCKLNDDWTISETEIYQSNLAKQNEIKIENEIKENTKQYKIDSIILELVQEVYLSLPQTVKDEIPQEAINKFNTLKNFLDSKI